MFVCERVSLHSHTSGGNILSVAVIKTCGLLIFFCLSLTTATKFYLY